MARSRADAGGFADVAPLDRPGPLRHRVQEALRELIILRALAPGQHLVESELAERLGVSRGPVREALQTLQTQGWVDLRPGRGAFVHDPTDAEADEVFAVRAALESEAAGLAAARMRPEDLEELRDICRTGRKAVAAGDESAVVAANSALHRRVAEHSGNRLLCDYIANLDYRVRWFYKPLVRSRGMTSWEEHDELIAALDAGDPHEAVRVMRRHTEGTRQAYPSVSGEHAPARAAPDADAGPPPVP